MLIKIATIYHSNDHVNHCLIKIFSSTEFFFYEILIHYNTEMNIINLLLFFQQNSISLLICIHWLRAVTSIHKLFPVMRARQSVQLIGLNQFSFHHCNRDDAFLFPGIACIYEYRFQVTEFIMSLNRSFNLQKCMRLQVLGLVKCCTLQG